ncbi:MAG: pyruvate kinase [Myxococcota bacterium]|jgi:pyruvate kinase
MRRAKIVCTLGPASANQATVDALVAAGMDCARLNFSHGTHAEHAATVARVREAAQKAGRPLAILGDLSGPKMRVGRFPDGPISLTKGQPFTITTEDVPGDATRVSTTYGALAADVEVGDDILLDDGLLRLRVTGVVGPEVRCEVMVGGPLSDKKGMNIPGRALSTPALTDKDRVDLAFAVDILKVDYLALSFVREAKDVLETQALAKGTPVIAKLEKPEAIVNLDAILDVADGAMVARGDLGVEMGPEKVPLLQKRIIREVNARNKLVITATQMLDSMIRNPSPTRAEATDVANAILDGSDALMLSGETASGAYPVESVEMMDRIMREIETHWVEGANSLQEIALEREWDFADAAAKAAAMMSFVVPIKAIVVFTRDGRTANILSEYRPKAPIVALTSDIRVARQLALQWGVIPRTSIPPEVLPESVRIATGLLLREGLASVGDAYALVMGWPPSSSTNTLKLHRI